MASEGDFSFHTPEGHCVNHSPGELIGCEPTDLYDTERIPFVYSDNIPNRIVGVDFASDDDEYLIPVEPNTLYQVSFEHPGTSTVRMAYGEQGVRDWFLAARRLERDMNTDRTFENETRPHR